MNTNTHPEPLLLSILAVDGDRITAFAKHWVEEYIRSGECALAFDGLLSEMEEGSYQPSEEAMRLLKMADEALHTNYRDRSL
jgi:hypothetical protein